VNIGSAKIQGVELAIISFKALFISDRAHAKQAYIYRANYNTHMIRGVSDYNKPLISYFPKTCLLLTAVSHNTWHAIASPTQPPFPQYKENRQP